MADATPNEEEQQQQHAADPVAASVNAAVESAAQLGDLPVGGEDQLEDEYVAREEEDDSGGDEDDEDEYVPRQRSNQEKFEDEGITVNAVGGVKKRKRSSVTGGPATVGLLHTQGSASSSKSRVLNCFSVAESLDPSLRENQTKIQQLKAEVKYISEQLGLSSQEFDSITEEADRQLLAELGIPMRGKAKPPVPRVPKNQPSSSSQKPAKQAKLTSPPSGEGTKKLADTYKRGFTTANWGNWDQNPANGQRGVSVGGGSQGSGGEGANEHATSSNPATTLDVSGTLTQMEEADVSTVAALYAASTAAATAAAQAAVAASQSAQSSGTQASVNFPMSSSRAPISGWLAPPGDSKAKPSADQDGGDIPVN